jgi:hypothetical protein
MLSSVPIGILRLLWDIYIDQLCCYDITALYFLLYFNQYSSITLARFFCQSPQRRLLTEPNACALILLEELQYQTRQQAIVIRA